MTDDKMLARIAALLRQAEGTDNAHEAEAFMAAAQRLATATSIDLAVARSLSVAALIGIGVAALGTGLHGRPAVSVLQLITLAAVGAFVVWASRRLLLGRTGYFTWFAIGFVAIWEGAKLIPTLLHGFVLAATPAFLTRAACVVCLACGIGLLRCEDAARIGQNSQNYRRRKNIHCPVCLH